MQISPAGLCVWAYTMLHHCKLPHQACLACVHSHCININKLTDTFSSFECIVFSISLPLVYTQITGNLILVLFYGALLAGAAKMISGKPGQWCVCPVILFAAMPDGAELLLDLGLPAAIIGGVVLPLLGAIPDSVMIVFSGMSGDREEANTQIAVGMGWGV